MIYDRPEMQDFLIYWGIADTLNPVKNAKYFLISPFFMTNPNFAMTNWIFIAIGI